MCHPRTPDRWPRPISSIPDFDLEAKAQRRSASQHVREVIRQRLLPPETCCAEGRSHSPDKCPLAVPPSNERPDLRASRHLTGISLAASGGSATVPAAQRDPEREIWCFLL